MRLTKAIKKVSKDTEKVFIRPANFPYSKFKLYYQQQIIGSGIKVVNDSGDPVTTFPIAILDGWNECIPEEPNTTEYTLENWSTKDLFEEIMRRFGNV